MSLQTGATESVLLATISSKINLAKEIFEKAVHLRERLRPVIMPSKTAEADSGAPKAVQSPAIEKLEELEVQLLSIQAHLSETLASLEI
jgi:hypothetical protein